MKVGIGAWMGFSPGLSLREGLSSPSSHLVLSPWSFVSRLLSPLLVWGGGSRGTTQQICIPTQPSKTWAGPPSRPPTSRLQSHIEGAVPAVSHKVCPVTGGLTTRVQASS